METLGSTENLPKYKRHTFAEPAVMLDLTKSLVAVTTDLSDADADLIIQTIVKRTLENSGDSERDTVAQCWGVIADRLSSGQAKRAFASLLGTVDVLNLKRMDRSEDKDNEYRASGHLMTGFEVLAGRVEGTDAQAVSRIVCERIVSSASTTTHGWNGPFDWARVLSGVRESDSAAVWVQTIKVLVAAAKKSRPSDSLDMEQGILVASVKKVPAGAAAGVAELLLEEMQNEVEVDRMDMLACTLAALRGNDRAAIVTALKFPMSIGKVRSSLPKGVRLPANAVPDDKIWNIVRLLSGMGTKTGELESPVTFSPQRHRDEDRPSRPDQREGATPADRAADYDVE